MIKANELRVGNYIRYRDEWDCEVMTIGSYFETHNKDLTDHLHGILCGSDDIVDYNPIPLNDEWLLRLGFNKVSHMNYKGRISALLVLARVSTGRIYIEVGGIYMGDRVNHVHEYQNLHFSLCGQELTIK